MDKIGMCIGLGGCSEVFEWGDNKVIKLYRSNTNRHAVIREFRNSMTAWESGLPAARPYEQIDIEGRPGIIFEKIIGDTLKDRLSVKLYNSIGSSLTVTCKNNDLLDYLDKDIRIIAELVYEVHKKSAPETLANQKDSIKHSINWPKYLTDSEKRTICGYLDELPAKNCLCHGDPNPNNFIMRDGNPVIIDWMNASAGNPVADIAEFFIMIKYAVLPMDTPASAVEGFNAIRDIVNEIFLDEYMKLSGMKYEEIDAWVLPVAARKLSADAISEDEKAILVDVIRQRLYK